VGPRAQYVITYIVNICVNDWRLISLSTFRDLPQEKNPRSSMSSQEKLFTPMDSHPKVALPLENPQVEEPPLQRIIGFIYC
jgi:hypothetical protein